MSHLEILRTGAMVTVLPRNRAVINLSINIEQKMSCTIIEIYQ